MLIREVVTGDLRRREHAAVRALAARAFGGRFDSNDWEHALGGLHIIGELGATIVAHASIVRRTLVVASREVDTGYVEAVATDPDHQRQGHGAAIMRVVSDVITRRHELGALSTGAPGFYERLGWERWRGATWALSPAGRVRTAGEDDGVMIWRTAATHDIDLTADVACDWRSGDVW